MTEIDLEALEAVAKAATPGPWEVDGNQPFSQELQGIFCEAAKRYVVKIDFDDQPENLADADHIAAFDPTTVLELIARVRDLEARVEAVLNMHYPVEIEQGETICAECSLQLRNVAALGKFPEWPCPTYKALITDTNHENEDE